MPGTLPQEPGAGQTAPVDANEIALESGGEEGEEGPDVTVETLPVPSAVFGAAAAAAGVGDDDEDAQGALARLSKRVKAKQQE